MLEACAGYFDELAHSFPKQPNRGLAEVFGPIRIINPTRQALTVTLQVPSKPAAMRGDLTGYDPSTSMKYAIRFQEKIHL